MAQRHQAQVGGDEQAWLALLVETFETVSREPKHNDAATIAGFKAQLARPAAAIPVGRIALH